MIIDRGLKNTILIGVLCLLCSSPSWLSASESDTLAVGWSGNQTYIQVDSANFIGYPLTNFVTVLPDTHSAIDYHEILSPARQAQFIPIYTDIKWDTPGISKYWLRATLRNSGDTPVDLWFFSGATHTLLYDENSSDTLVVHEGGRNLPYDKNQAYWPRKVYPRQRLIPIHLEAYQAKTLHWYSVFPDYWKRYQSRTLEGHLVTQEYYEQKQDSVTQSNYSFAVLMGMIGAITLFLFIFYAIYREESFFALAFLALAILIWNAYQKGFLFTTILANSTSKSAAYDLGELVIIPLNHWAIVYYVINFLDLREHSQRWYHTVIWTCAIVTTTIVISALIRFIILPHDFSIHVLVWQAVNIAMTIFYFLIPVSAIHLTIKRIPMAGVFLLGNSFALITAGLNALSMNFSQFGVFNGIDKWGPALMLITFSIALAYRMRLIDSEKKLAEEELVQIDADLKAAAELDAMKTSFFTSISHEFRTPLTLIMGPLEKLYSESRQKKNQERVQLVQRNARRMQNLINQLLDLAKIQSTQSVIKVSEQGFSQHLRTIAAAHTSLAESKDIKFTTNIPDDELLLYYNREMMNKIVNNLLSNAFKYCSDHGEVILSVNQNDTTLELQVENSGEPIPVADQDRIFDHFQRAKAVDGLTAGSGIGLSLVKDYVNLHHGEVQLDSKPGEKIRFSAIFKRGHHHFNTDEIETTVDEIEPDEDLILVNEPDRVSPKKPGDKEEKPLILIVEDNNDMRQFVSDELTDSYKIITAVNGRVGLETARESVPDLVISDVMMPEMDGFTFLEKLRSDPLICHIPTVMLTALSTDEAKFKGLETGADDYLLKPFSSRELRIRIANLISQRQRLRERFNMDKAQDLKEFTESSIDEKFLRNIMEAIESNLDDSEFGVDALSKQVYMSRSQLYRKLTALTNLNPADFLRIQRLKRAASLLDQHTGNITEIAFLVGFQNPGHFATSFKKQFGVSPSEYQQRSIV